MHCEPVETAISGIEKFQCSRCVFLSIFKAVFNCCPGDQEMRIAHILNRRDNNLLLSCLLLISMLVAASHAWSAPVMTDADITVKVEEELLFDSAVPFSAIDVSTTEGVVTLTGVVSHLLAKERATRIAETVRGVRSVVNRIDVKPVMPQSAENLRAAVKNALLYDAATESYEIGVSANDQGQVTLSGEVESWGEHNLAEKIAKNINGVIRVDNNLMVKPATTRLDAEIKPEIEGRLRWDVMVDDGLIDVRVKEGKVFLSGTVGSAAEKSHAERNAWVSGVKEVDSSALKVEKWARDDELRKQKYIAKSDAEIRDAVKDALFYDPRVNTFNVDVSVVNGGVTLQGVVDNLEAKIAAQRDAGRTVGVISVNNLLKVRPVTELSDSKIAENIRNALLRNAYTNSYEITVRVQDQTAYLAGVVDSYFEKAEAQNVAFRANGVNKVRNNLVVGNPTTVVYDPYVDNWSIYDYPWYSGPIAIQNKSDWQIAQDIQDELWWSPFVDSDDITVSVVGGVATLTGTVDSWSEYYDARENAFEGGAISVINKLDVK
jgi:osmotically-inducible protein OsmY